MSKTVVSPPPVVTVLQAAAEKRCTRQAIYRALNETRLNELRLGSTRLILRDKDYRRFEARRYGSRR